MITKTGHTNVNHLVQSSIEGCKAHLVGLEWKGAASLVVSCTGSVKFIDICLRSYMQRVIEVCGMKNLRRAALRGLFVLRETNRCQQGRPQKGARTALSVSHPT